MNVLDDISTDDFNVFLHALRSRRLARMPAETGVVLSGGADAQWYFDWFARHYPGRVKRHIAVEYFSPPPDHLPEGVEWLARTLGDLSPVRDGEVDLVFAGQVIEHLWPDDMAGFISEAHRVLRPGGALVIDSPTRLITEALAWTQPEHTIELNVDEITELLTLAGFVDIDVKGIWLCYDRDRARVLPLGVFAGGDDWPWRRRVIEAEQRPDDSFIWWAECRRNDGAGNSAAVGRRVREIYDRVRPTYFERMHSEIGESSVDSSARLFRAGRGRRGILLRGPSIAMPPGHHEAWFRLRAEPTDSRPARSQKVADIEVTRDGDREVVKWSLKMRDLPPGGAEREIVLPFQLSETAFNCELRVDSTGIVPLVVHLPAAVHESTLTVDRPRARPLGRDPANLRLRAAGWDLGRAFAWPARRLLDPRLEGLRSHITYTATAATERIDTRTDELTARLEALAKSLPALHIETTAKERTAVLPYVLSAVGNLALGTTILVSGECTRAITLVLESLGYEVLTPSSLSATQQVAAAVVCATSIDPAALDHLTRTLRPRGVVVLAIEGITGPGVEELLTGWEIEDISASESEAWSRLTLARLSHSVPVAPRQGSS